METSMIPVEKLDEIKELLVELMGKVAEESKLRKLMADEAARRYLEVRELIELTERAKTHLSARRTLLRRLKDCLNTTGGTHDKDEVAEIKYVWISVNDRLPPPETKVIVRRSTGEVLPDSLRDTVYAIDWYREKKAAGKYTHWTPLPEYREA
jgi:hypothetical protein